MSDVRPDPETLLRRIQHADAQQQRGRLKIFLGMCAGVGKTYAMLEAGRVRAIEGLDVLVGLIETHGRTETEQLLLGHDLLPVKHIQYRGMELTEFDLDACLQRHPDLVLLDELAHTNAPGARHQRRYQDVEELLAAGISVYTSLNIQHIESQCDIVAQITGATVRETVPDSIIDLADEIELVDLNPEELLGRLKEGKVYIPQQAQLALERFFKPGNLIALRELALRFVAERVDRQIQQYRREQRVGSTWPVRERLLVCVTASPQSARLVRATRRLATRLQAEWLAVHVETPRTKALPRKERERLYRILQLAEQLGAQTTTLSGTRVVDELVAFARARNVTKIVVGKSAEPRWRRLLFGSFVDELARKSGDVDLQVISGEGDAPAVGPMPRRRAQPPWRGLLGAALAVAGCTAFAGLIFRRLNPANIVMLYLLCVALVALRGGRAAAVLASILSVAAFDFFFVKPYLTFAVTDVEYLLTFAVMLAVGLVVSNLTARLKEQLELSRRREEHTAALYALTRDLADVALLDQLIATSARHIEATFQCPAALYLRDAVNGLRLAGGMSVAADEERERAVARWVLDHGQKAGCGTNTLPAARALYLPLSTATQTVGVLAVVPRAPEQFLDPDELHLLETFAQQTALAAERVELAQQAEQARLQAESEQVRNALLRTVSHDLRTPLATITGALSTILANPTRLDAQTSRDLLQSAYDEGARLNQLLGNLLDMTRLEAGHVQLKQEPYPLEELVGAALNRLEAVLNGQGVETSLPRDLPLVLVDAVLVEQVLLNLLENAARYAAPGKIEIRAHPEAAHVLVEVLDQGAGLQPGTEREVFRKFYRSRPPTDRSGTGLGLAICEAIVRLHGGRIGAENRPDGGARFWFTLPRAAQPSAAQTARMSADAQARGESGDGPPARPETAAKQQHRLPRAEPGGAA